MWGVKATLLMIAMVALVGGCSKSQSIKDKISNTWWVKIGDDDEKFILRDDGTTEFWDDGKREGKGTWTVVDDEIHVILDKETGIFKLGEDEGLVLIAPKPRDAGRKPRVYIKSQSVAAD